jgi:signal transduction histidine kinase
MSVRRAACSDVRARSIAPDLLDHLFEPFIQADPTLDRSKGGLGLGLALVRGLVELHGGTVSARSEGLGAGAELTVTLPLVGGIEAPASELGKALLPTKQHVLLA